METDQDKMALGKQVFGDFFQQFGNDVYSRIMLEVLFEELFGINSDKVVEKEK